MYTQELAANIILNIWIEQREKRRERKLDSREYSQYCYVTIENRE